MRTAYRNPTTKQLQRSLVTAALTASIFLGVACKKTPVTSEDSIPVATSARALGIDTTGGTIFVVKLLPSKNSDGQEFPVTDRAITSSIKAINRRLESICPEKFAIKRETGSSRINISLVSASTQQVQQVKICLETPGNFEIKLVHPDNHSLMVKFKEDPDNFIIPGYSLMDFYDRYDGTSEKLLIRRRAFIDGSHIIEAKELSKAQKGMIAIKLNEKGAKYMHQATEKMKHGFDRIAIILDRKIFIAPVVQSSLGSQFHLGGIKDAVTAKAIASALLAPLSNPIIIEEQRTIPAQPKN